jgi:hypothetical protein
MSRASHVSSTPMPTPSAAPACDWRQTPTGAQAIARMVEQAGRLEFFTMSRHDLANWLTTQANILRTGRDEAGTLEKIGAFALAGLYARLRAEAQFRRSAGGHAAVTASKMENLK